MVRMRRIDFLNGEERRPSLIAANDNGSPLGFNSSVFVPLLFRASMTGQLTAPVCARPQARFAGRHFITNSFTCTPFRFAHFCSQACRAFHFVIASLSFRQRASSIPDFAGRNLTIKSSFVLLNAWRHIKSRNQSAGQRNCWPSRLPILRSLIRVRCRSLACSGTRALRRRSSAPTSKARAETRLWSLTPSGVCAPACESPSLFRVGEGRPEESLHASASRSGIRRRISMLHGSLRS